MDGLILLMHNRDWEITNINNNTVDLVFIIYGIINTNLKKMVMMNEAMPKM